jgi:hypothetical protein
MLVTVIQKGYIFLKPASLLCVCCIIYRPVIVCRYCHTSFFRLTDADGDILDPVIVQVLGELVQSCGRISDGDDAATTSTPPIPNDAATTVTPPIPICDQGTIHLAFAAINRNYKYDALTSDAGDLSVKHTLVHIAMNSIRLM